MTLSPTADPPRGATRRRSGALARAVVVLVLILHGSPARAQAATDLPTTCRFDVGGQKLVAVTLPKGAFQRSRYLFGSHNMPSVPTGWGGTEWWLTNDSQRGRGLRSVYSLHYRPKEQETLDAAGAAWLTGVAAAATERGWNLPKPPTKWTTGKQKLGTVTAPVLKATYTIEHPRLPCSEPPRAVSWMFEAGDSIVVATSVTFEIRGELSAVLFGALAIENVPAVPPPLVHTQLMDNVDPYACLTLDVPKPWEADHGRDLETCVAGWLLKRDGAVIGRMYVRGEILVGTSADVRAYAEERRQSYVAAFTEVSELGDVRTADGKKGWLVSFVEPPSEPKPKAWTTHVYFNLGPVIWSLAMSTTEEDDPRRAEITKSFGDVLKTFHLWSPPPK